MRAAMSVSAIIAEEREPGPVLVVVFLRGGADGLHLVVPHGDDDYYRARPSIAKKRSEVIDLDGIFGFNALLEPLHRFWCEGALAVVHAAGSEDESRSHFEAQDFMEHGGVAAGGWLGRFLRVRPGAGHSVLTAVAFGPQLPACLRGAPSCVAIQSLRDFGLGQLAPAGFASQLAALYGRTPGALGEAGRNALAVMNRLEAMGKEDRGPEHGAVYDETDGFAQGLRQIARLIKARVGLQAAAIDLGGWDSHITTSVLIDGPTRRLGRGLAAFATDLGPAQLARTQIVVMSEFGRRVAENSAGGTDHGRGGVMLLLGGGIVGGRVHGEWPGLAPSCLTGPGDVPVRHNYREVLAPLLQKQAPGVDLSVVFPGYPLSPLASLV